jgi:hypothetical protein
MKNIYNTAPKDLMMKNGRWLRIKNAIDSNGWMQAWVLISALSAIPIFWFAYNNYPKENIDLQWAIEGNKIHNSGLFNPKVRSVESTVNEHKKIGDLVNSPRLNLVDEEFVDSVKRMNEVNNYYETKKFLRLLYYPKCFVYWVLFSAFLLLIGYSVRWMLRGFKNTINDTGE